MYSEVSWSPYLNHARYFYLLKRRRRASNINRWLKKANPKKTLQTFSEISDSCSFTSGKRKLSINTTKNKKNMFIKKCLSFVSLKSLICWHLNPGICLQEKSGSTFLRKSLLTRQTDTQRKQHNRQTCQGDTQSTKHLLKQSTEMVKTLFIYCITVAIMFNTA